MQLVQERISIETLRKMSEKMFGGLVKAVVDVEAGIMVVDAGLHADQEQFLLQEGFAQKNLWGVNLYPDLAKDDSWIEFDSMINLRPGHNNRTRSVDNLETQDKVRSIINRLVIV